MTQIIAARSDRDSADVTALVWEFFTLLGTRYPEMKAVTEAYIKRQDVEGQLTNFAQFFTPPAGECFVARRDGDAVGIVMIRPRGTQDGELNRMYVRDSARGLGLGRALCQRAIQQARDLGYETLYLDALYRHVEALSLYPSMGFERYTDPDNPDAGDERVISMRLDLTTLPNS